MRLSDVASRPAFELVRDGEFESLGFVTYDTPGLLVFLEAERYVAELLENPAITCVITTADLVDRLPPGLGVAVVQRPRAAFYGLHAELASTDFYWPAFETEISPGARVHPRAYVAEKNVRIGARCVIEPNATILERTILEEDVVVRAGAVVSCEGFQVNAQNGALSPVPHAGGVRLERGVELQANSVVDRAIFGGFTVIGQDTKIDNLVHIAHNCRLGKRNRIVAGAMLAGSLRTGDDVWFGPMCAVSDGLTIGSGAFITMGAVVTRDVPAGARVSGNFAIDHAQFIAHMRTIR